MALSVQIVEDLDGLRALREPWRELLAAHPAPNPFLSFEWALAWAETLGKDAQLLVVLLREGERIRAIAPCCIQAGRTLSLLGYPQSDYGDLLLDTPSVELVRALLDALWQERRRWRRAVFDQLHQEHSQWRAMDEALRASAMPFRLEEGDFCPAMLLRDPVADKKQYYKKNINNYVNWFKRQGEFGFEQHDDVEVALQRLEELFQQHIARWDGTPTPSSFRREEVRQFYRRFVAALLPLGKVRSFALRLDDGFLAFYLCLQEGRTLYLYKPSHNPEYHHHSPGQVILRYLFDYASEQGLTEMDYARGDEGYKGRFANHARRNRRILIYPNALARLAADTRHTLRYAKPVDGMLRNPRVRALVDKLRN